MKRVKAIFLPGWGFNKNIWKPLSSLNEFADLHYVDWHGIDSLAQINERVFNELNSDKNKSFMIIGWSLGALAGLKIAEQYPDRVNRLILFSGTSCFTRQDHYDYGWDSRVIKRMKSRLKREPEATLADFYELMFSSEEKKKGWNHKEHIQPYCSQDRVSSLNCGLDYLLENDNRERLKQINHPILLIHGDSDVICPPMASEYIYRNSPNVRFKMLKEAGHLPFHTNTNLCLKWMKEFIQEGVCCD